MAPVSMTEPARQATWQTHELPVLQKTREERMLELSTKAPSAQHGMAIVDEKQPFFWISN